MPEASTCAIATRGRSPVEVATSETEISLGSYGVQTDTISIAALPGYNPIYKRYDWEGNFIENLMPKTAKFTLKRLGGCGGATLTVIADITDYDNLPDLHDIISIEYTDGTPWYRGYVVKCKVGLNGNATIELGGYANLMKEVKVGALAYGDKSNWTKPPWVSQEDWDDAWAEIEQLSAVTNIGEIVSNLIQRYNIVSALYHVPQVTGSEIDTFAIELKCIAFKLNLSYFEAFTHLALWAKAAWGIDENGVFFFKKRRQDVLTELRVGWNAEQFDREKSKDYLYNIVSIMGTFTLKIMWWVFSIPYFFTCYDQDSIDEIGPRGYPNILWAPQIGCQEDAEAFAAGFFDIFANADYNFAAQENNSQVLVRPWQGMIAFKGEDNIILTERYCDKVDYSFRKDALLTVAAGKELMMENWAIYKGRSGANPSGRDDWPKAPITQQEITVDSQYHFYAYDEDDDGIGDFGTFWVRFLAGDWENGQTESYRGGCCFYIPTLHSLSINRAYFYLKLEEILGDPWNTLGSLKLGYFYLPGGLPYNKAVFYEQSCTEISTISPMEVGEELKVDVTDAVKAAIEAGQDWIGFKFYFTVTRNDNNQRDSARFSITGEATGYATLHVFY